MVARNVRLWPGEIDLLVLFGGLRVVVEVRSRWREDPVEVFTIEKAARLRRAGARLDPPPDRYDLVAVRFGGAGVDVRWLPGIC